MFLLKVVLKICSKFTGEHPCQSLVSIKLLCKFIEIALWHRCSPLNLMHIFRISFSKNTSLEGCLCSFLQDSVKLFKDRFPRKSNFVIKNVSAWLREWGNWIIRSYSDVKLNCRIKYLKYVVIALMLCWRSIHLAAINFQLLKLGNIIQYLKRT